MSNPIRIDLSRILGRTADSKVMSGTKPDGTKPAGLKPIGVEPDASPAAPQG